MFINFVDPDLILDGAKILNWGKLINTNNVDYFEVFTDQSVKPVKYVLLGVKMMDGTPNRYTSTENSHARCVIYETPEDNDMRIVWERLTDTLIANVPFATINLPTGARLPPGDDAGRDERNDLFT